MKLYHGTRGDIARLAPEHGLSPRNDTGVESHWPDNPSRDDLVYLTDAYALYFAIQATETDEPLGIIEIDSTRLDDALLLPDEDFLEQVARGAAPAVSAKWEGWPEGGSMEARTEWFKWRLETFAHHWKDSLRGLGNVAHAGSIPAEAVTRIGIIDPTKAKGIVWWAMDPAICLMNYQICGDKYRAMCEWAVGRSPQPVRFLEFPIQGAALDPATMDMLAEQTAAIEDALTACEAGRDWSVCRWKR
jgi:hypothetical protein